MRDVVAIKPKACFVTVIESESLRPLAASAALVSTNTPRNIAIKPHVTVHKTVIPSIKNLTFQLLLLLSHLLFVQHGQAKLTSHLLVQLSRW
jgi:hypothetical protein